MRLWGSARRLHRSGSSRSLPRRPERSDTSSSAEYASTDSAPHSPTSESDRGRDFVVMGDRLMGKESVGKMPAIVHSYLSARDFAQEASPEREMHTIVSRAASSRLMSVADTHRER